MWQKGLELVSEIYKTTQGFPREEKYALSSQMRRIVVSIPSNITDGFRGRYDKERKQFINIALGSYAELETQIIISKESGYIDVLIEAFLMETLDQICAVLVNLNKKI